MRFWAPEDGFMGFGEKVMWVYGGRFGKGVESDVGIWRQLCAERSECCRYMRFWAPEDEYVNFGCKVMSVYGGCQWMDDVKWCRYMEVGGVLMV